MRKRICIFCGSNTGTQVTFVEAATKLAADIAIADMELVYGGGRVGLMGVIADAALALGGRVIGVMPESLIEREVAHQNLSELIVVSSMHERKAVMESLSDAFIALPGGFGTLDEFFEILTWAQLGIHQKPCGMLNIDGYFDHIVGFMNLAVSAGFVHERHRDMVVVSRNVDELLPQLLDPCRSVESKWSLV
ncbi:MAG: TIGR00730 family Rossman fold protein [Candidatus Obscuribacterales bacterium]|nr:TIGR00730 family Rossman fold protein [Candidatus Obscuribacterales bacterium]